MYCVDLQHFFDSPHHEIFHVEYIDVPETTPAPGIAPYLLPIIHYILLTKVLGAETMTQPVADIIPGTLNVPPTLVFLTSDTEKTEALPVTEVFILTVITLDERLIISNLLDGVVLFILIQGVSLVVYTCIASLTVFE